MLAKGVNLKADVLKVGHHGSDTSTSPQFLQAVSPQYAVIEVGAGNDYGHPHQVTLDKLAAANVKVYRTDLNGTVLFESDGNNITVSAQAPSITSISTTIKLTTTSFTTTQVLTNTTTTSTTPTTSTTIGTTPTTSTTTSTTPTPSMQTTTTSTLTDLMLQIISVTSPVAQGSNATLVANTSPGANCDITVYYKSGPSTASGLSPKISDSHGTVSWTWKVGANTTPGSWRIVVSVTLNGQTVTQETSFTVI